MTEQNHSERKEIHTDLAPTPIGIYSQGLKVGNTVYLAGQVGMIPQTGELIADDILSQLRQVFENLDHAARASGGTLQDCVKFTVYLMDLKDIVLVNEVMQQYLSPPYPARTSIQISKLPKNALVEIDAILQLHTTLAFS